MSDNRRVRGLIRKEFLQILRDPSSIAIAFLMPVFLLLLFGYGLSLDAEHVPLAVVVEKPSAETARFTGMLQQSRYFSPQHFASMRDAELALRMHEVNGIVHLRASFAADLKAERESGIQVIVNGVDANTAGMWFDRASDGLIWDQRMFWVFVLIYLAVKGAGKVSLDHLVSSRTAG